jgi:hypothetical protein
VDGLLATGVEREQCQRLVVTFGVRVLPYFDRVLARHPSEPGAQFFASAVALRSRAALGWALKHLGRATPDRAMAIGRALNRDRMRAWPRPLRRFLRTRVVGLIHAGRFESRAAVQVAFGLLAEIGPLARE